MYKRPNITKAITVTAILATGALGAGTAHARPLEGDGGPATSCGQLERFQVGTPGSYPKAKVYAVAGLTGDDADAEFERIQAAVTERCSSPSSSRHSGPATAVQALSIVELGARTAQQ